MQFVLNTQTYDQILQAEKSALKDTASYVYGLLKDKIQTDAFDSWEYLKSLFLKSIGIGDVIQIGSATPQAVIMEYGRRPLQKRPPLNSLIPWAERKWIIQDSADEYQDLSSQSKSAIYLLAKHIWTKWIAPRAIFRTIYNNHQQEINEYFISRLQHSLWKN